MRASGYDRALYVDVTSKLIERENPRGIDLALGVRLESPARSPAAAVDPGTGPG